LDFIGSSNAATVGKYLIAVSAFKRMQVDARQRVGQGASKPAEARNHGRRAYDASLKRIYMTGGRWYGTPEASSGWVYVYQQKDPDHYDLLSKIKTRFWHLAPGTPTQSSIRRDSGDR
jgi:hypothetical protein